MVNLDRIPFTLSLFTRMVAWLFQPRLSIFYHLSETGIWLLMGFQF